MCLNVANAEYDSCDRKNFIYMVLNKMTRTTRFTLMLSCAAAISLLLLNESVLASILDNGLYTLLGVFAATFANLSGAGGGIVFVPVFTQLGLTEAQILANSFGIQCFGMTAGALTWSRHYVLNHRSLPSHQSLPNEPWRPFTAVIAMTSVTSIAGIWSVYAGMTGSPPSLHWLFSAFSIFLGLILLVQVLLFNNNKALPRNQLQMLDYPAILLIGYFGGVITAWLSVGVGEILVLYLILRGYCTTMSIAAAVVVTAFTVWAGAVEHLWLSDHTVWNIVLFAGPGAVIGGIAARSIAAKISTKALKIVLASWILLMGIFG